MTRSRFHPFSSYNFNEDFEMDLDVNESDEDEDEEDCIVFDEDILRRLKSNDPAISALEINLGGLEMFDALSIDWKLEGGAIAENTHLSRCLHIIMIQRAMKMQQQMQNHFTVHSPRTGLSRTLVWMVVQLMLEI